MTTYDVGDLAHCRGAFRDEDGDPQDPVAVFFKFRFDNGSVTTYEYGVDSELVKDSAGNYSVNVDTTGHEGQYCYYRFDATGVGQTAGEDRFYVQRSRLV